MIILVQKVQLIEAIKKMALNNINTKYEHNFEEFRQYNHNINIFLRNIGYNSNQDLVTNDDYLGVLSEFEMKFYKVITNKEGEVFSNTLILAFIIGSLFLNIYSKIMK